MPITFKSNGGFLNGNISSSNGDLFITTSGSVGAINVGQQLELTGSQIIEKDTSGVVRNKKTFNADGSITQEKFDASGKTAETKVKNPSTGRENVRSGSATENQIEFQQNSQGAFITVSGSVPGYNIVKTGATNDYRTIRQTKDFFYSNNNAIFTIGVDGVNDNTWFVNSTSAEYADSNSVLRVSASGDVFVKGNIHAQEFHTELISSSIVFQSGSTQFGDTHDDTHTFTGKFTNAITASADISSSGAIIGNTISIATAANVTDLTNLNIADSTGQTGINMTLSAINGRLSGVTSGLTTTSDVQFNHITASGNISSSGTITMLTASIGGGIFTSASLAAGGSGGDSSFTAAGISGSLGLNATTIRSLTKASISGSFTAASSSLSTRVSLNDAKVTANTSNVTSAGALMDSELSEIATVKSLTKAGISGSLGTNATLIRTLTANSISGSSTTLSSSLAGRVSTNELKLSGIENNADVTDTSNVTSAGALMDSEVTSLALIKGLTAASISGSITDFSASVSTRLTTEESDFTAAGISGSLGGNATLIRSLTANSISGSTYSLSSSLAGRITTNEVKLDGIESSADVTDTSNVTSAGALMDSEVASLALIKTITAADISGSSTTLSSSLASRTTTLEGNGVFTAASISGSTYSLSSSLAGRVTTNETKLSNIENNADVTDTSNVTSAGALMDSELSEIATVKALTKSNISGSLGTNATLIRTLTANSISGSTYSLSSSLASRTTTLEGNGVFTAAGISGSLGPNASLIRSLSAANISGSISATSVAAAGALMDSEMTDLAGVKGVTISTLQVKPSEGAFANGDKTKLDGIEGNADVTDTSNVTSAGALMDSELSEIATVKALTKASISGSFGNQRVGTTDDVAFNDISASGNVQVTQITASSFQFSGTGTAELEVQGDITASGTISASSIIATDGDFNSIDVEATANLDVVDIDGPVTYASRTVFEPATFSLNDTSPDVRVGRVFLTNNNTTTAINAFDNGTAGQIIHIIHMDNNTDYTDGTNLQLFRGLDHTSAQTNDTITFVCVDGTKWVELGRSDNT